MSNPTYLVKLNGTDITSYLKAPNGYKVAPNKLWTDAGRDLTGNLHSTRLGTYPKIALNFKSLTESEMQTISAILDNSSISVIYWYTVSGSYKSGNYYAGDFEMPIRNLAFESYEEFSVDIIPYEKVT